MSFPACPPRQFAAFRIGFGLYLAGHFAAQLPWAAELFGARGLPSVLSSGAGGEVVPAPAWNVVALFGFEAWPAVVLVALVATALAFAAGVGRVPAALVLWAGWVCLFERNGLLANPSLPYVGWLLLACALVPPGEPWRLSPRGVRPGRPDRTDRCDWSMIPAVYWGAWVVMAVAYTASGLDKLGSPGWRDGSAIGYALALPYAWDNPLRDALLSLPLVVQRLLTWSVLGIELAFAPLALFRVARPVVWLGAFVMHAGILLVFDFGDLTAGLLAMHAFTFDARWLPSARHPGPGRAGATA